MDDKIRYPIGKFSAPASHTLSEINNWINEIEGFPAKLRDELRNFTEEMLDESYRQDGWTARQVVHHLADSHMNAYVRFKLALTEDTPTIKPYFEDRWASLDDSKSAPPDVSLNLLEALHKRWTIVLKNIPEKDYERSFFHPESNKEFPLWHILALYVWHGNHHLGHIRAIKRKFATA